MGRRMSGTASCAFTEPSTNSTSECTMLSRCSSTRMRSSGTPNSHEASITSSPLFINVAESMVILAPIRQVGCCSASAGVTARRRSRGRSRNAPPEAVRINAATSAALPSGVPSPRKHCQIALCSLSMGSTATWWARAAAMTRCPAITSASLLASATVFPASIAASVGRRPWRPTTASSTKSAAHSCTSVVSASGPVRRRPAGISAAGAGGSASAASAGRQVASCSANSGDQRPAASATTSKRSGWAATTSSACRPIEPVEPKIASRLRTRSPTNARYVVVCYHPRGQKTIEPVQQAPMAQQEPAAVLGAELALDEALAQVAGGGRDTDQHAQPRDLPEGAAGGWPQGPEQQRGHAGCQHARHRALPRLVRAQARRELGAPPTAADEERGDIGGPGAQKHGAHPVLARGQGTQEQEVRQQAADVQCRGERGEPVEQAVAVGMAPSGPAEREEATYG